MMFVIETFDTYPRKVCFTVMGDKINDVKRYNVGDTVKVHFNAESREYMEKWYTDLRAWKIDAAAEGGNNAMPQNDNFNAGFAPSNAASMPQGFEAPMPTDEDMPF